jgi:hypothetical protein
MATATRIQVDLDGVVTEWTSTAIKIVWPVPATAMTT